MSSREANIERLNYAITSLNEDAEGIHGLIAKSASELENATAAGNRAADNAAQIVEALTPLTEMLNTQHDDSNAMLEEARKASEATGKQVDELKQAFRAFEAMQTEALEDIKVKTLKEHERTRDELQADILGFKNATSARVETLEAEVSKVQDAVKGLEGRITESAAATSKKLLAPIYAAIGLGAVDLVCLVMLLTR